LDDNRPNKEKLLSEKQKWKATFIY
jgi:hypothetical protein